ITGAPPAVPPCGQVYSGPGGGGDGEAVVIDENGEVTIIAMDNFFDPNTLQAASGQALSVTMTNEGEATHNLVFYAGDSAEADIITGDPEAVVPSGEELTLEFTAPAEAGDYFFQCVIHAGQMVGTLIVE
ncbi:MAG TPA: cupredoxin domain-containing protein, partial [Dehalococcoidia bacterium]|nr:cupredoxin domain-containing protein [Dehalococcoidia bacterium]